SSGAALSVIQGLGVFASLYALRLGASTFERGCFALMALIDAASTIVTGRTGLLMAAAFLGVFALASRRLAVRLMIVGVLAWAAVPLAVFGDDITDVISRSNPTFAITASWGLGVFQRGLTDPVLNDLASQPVPRLTLETLVGTGLVADSFGNA